jgi:hypothetical protein
VHEAACIQVSQPTPKRKVPLDEMTKSKGMGMEFFAEQTTPPSNINCPLPQLRMLPPLLNETVLIWFVVLTS